MKWKKLGNIYNPDQYGEEYTYGSNPFPLQLKDNIYRIFYNIRDRENRSYITFLDYDLISCRILYISPEPVIAPGDKGLFDDSGCSLGCVLDMGEERKYIYYIGWNLGVTVPWRNFIGLAVYNPKESTFYKYSKAPVMDRCAVDSLSISYPYILKENDTFRMWYGSNTAWANHGNSMTHVIKYAESEDGIHWKRDNQICIQGSTVSEYAFSKPSVIFEDGIYKMWYSYRGEHYRIGYAESIDGLSWKRMDHLAGISVSESGWDSEMIDYPAVFLHNKSLYMLYCGNGYGKTGFGLAKLSAGEI